MAFFSGRGPKLPSFADLSLDGLTADPHWSGALGQAGWDVGQCDLVWRVDQASIGTGPGSVPVNAGPALVLGRGPHIAIAFAGEREVKVVSRPKDRAQLQTQRSGAFQILFGPVQRMDLWMFFNLQTGTPEGDRFGRTVLDFLEGRSAPETPPSGRDNLSNRPGKLGTDITPTPAAPLSVTPDLVAQARDLMDHWTRVVGQASDEVFWEAVARFGRIGGATDVPRMSRGGADPLRAAVERPWRTWIGIGKKANEIRDYELAVRIFLYAWAIKNQVVFDDDITRACGYQEPSDEIFRDIALQALAAVEAAPADFSVVERTIAAPVAKQSLQMGLNQLLESLPTDPVTPAASDQPSMVQRADDANSRESRPQESPTAAQPSLVLDDLGLILDLIHRLAGTCSEVMRLHAEADNKSGDIQRARNVVAMPQHPISRESFRQVLGRLEDELTEILSGLSSASDAGRNLWQRVLLVAGVSDPSAGDGGMATLLTSLSAEGSLQSDEVGSIMIGGLFMKTDFGTTLDTFLDADQRLAQIMRPLDRQ